jgi:hypothetical protein
MSQYVLRNLPPELWAKVHARADREGWPLRQLFLALLDDYAEGRIQLTASPISREFAWAVPLVLTLLAAEPGFFELPSAQQWMLIVTKVAPKAPTRAEGLTLQELDAARRTKLLAWLKRLL